MVKMSLSKPSTTKFQPSYILEYPWVKEHPTINTKAICTWCHKEIDITGMGKQALKSHAKSKKHSLNLKNRQTCLPLQMFAAKDKSENDRQQRIELGLGSSLESQPSTSTSQPNQPVLREEPSPTQSSNARTKSITKQFLIAENVTKSEIFWCLQIVDNHISFRAGGRCATGFSSQFPDSEIADKLKLEHTKVGYLVVFGLGPYFGRQLESKVIKSPQLVLCFDEALNKVSQRLQMDLHVRWWDPSNNNVKTRYYTSVFLGHSTASDLLEAIKSGVPAEVRSKIIQISMDGPNVNLKMLKDLQEELKSSPNSPILLDIGSCGLHTLHGAFKTGMLATKWGLKKFLRSLYNLFKNSPARRADFIHYTGSDLFPLKFCEVRWVESGRVANRAVEVLPAVKIYVEKKVAAKNEPSCDSFAEVKDNLKDALLPAKLAFFSSICALFEPLLREFQSDAPLAPFMYSEINSLLLTLTERIVKKDHLDEVNNNMAKVDLSEKNLIATKHLDLGFATKDALKKCAATSQLEKLNFFQGAKTALLSMTKKIIEKSPIKFALSKSITCLDPSVIKSKRGEVRVTACLEELVGKNWITGMTADLVKREYQNLFSRENVIDKCKSFKRKDTRLDEFFTKIIDEEGVEDFKNLTKFISFILTLSHGNASVERGFSINKECLVPNLKEDSLVAIRKVQDGISDAGGVKSVDITKEMIHSARNASSRYNEYLSKKKEEMKSLMNEVNDRKQAEKERKVLEAERLEVLSEARKRAAALDEKINDLSKKIRK